MKTMKQLLLAVLFVPLLNGSNMDAITRAISTGDVNALGQYLDQTVEIAIPNQEDLYEKAEASAILKGFFSQHVPKAFSQVHQGTSKGNDSLYCIGNLTTSNGTFRVYIYMHLQNGKLSIQELRFDKE